MNKKVVQFHLQEAYEELTNLLKEIDEKKDFSEVDLEISLGHAYHHINTAWNGREQTDEQHNICNQEDFDKFRKFPNEKEFTYLSTE